MTPDRTAIAVLAMHHLVQNQFTNEQGYVPGNLAVAGILIGIGRSAGLSWDEMGLNPDRIRSGLRLGTRISAPALLVAAGALANRRTRSHLRDERARVDSARQVWYRALVRFPLGTALFEEVAFRGVLPALLARNRPRFASDALSAALFGMWHLIPTRRAVSGNPINRELSPARRTAFVIGGSALAGVFGLGFSELRRRSGSLAAPWLAHATLNTLTFLGGVAAWKSPRVVIKSSPGSLLGLAHRRE